MSFLNPLEEADLEVFTSFFQMQKNKAFFCHEDS